MLDEVSTVPIRAITILPEACVADNDPRKAWAAAILRSSLLVALAAAGAAIARPRLRMLAHCRACGHESAVG